MGQVPPGSSKCQPSNRRWHAPAAHAQRASTAEGQLTGRKGRSFSNGRVPVRAEHKEGRRRTKSSCSEASTTRHVAHAGVQRADRDSSPTTPSTSAPSISSEENRALEKCLFGEDVNGTSPAGAHQWPGLGFDALWHCLIQRGPERLAVARGWSRSYERGSKRCAFD
jgi:hypothetical protein